MGGAALSLLRGEKCAIESYRGTVVEDRPGIFHLPTIHPAKLFKNQTLQFACVEDWKKVARIQAEGPTRVPPPFEDWQWQPTFENVALFLDGILRQGADLGPWSIDFEATLDRRVVCLGIWSCDRPTERYGLCIPFLQQGGGSYWSCEDESKVMQLVREFFTREDIGIVGQNIVGYDTGYPPFNTRSLIKLAWDIDVRGIVGDTLAAHHTCFAELRHSLAFQASIATDMPPFKIEVWEDDDDSDVDESDWARILDRPDKKLRIYNLCDAFSTALIWNGLVKEMAA